MSHIEGTFVALCAPVVWNRRPRHALDVPPGWAKAFHCDFSMDDQTLFATRERALEFASDYNAAAAEADRDQPDGWVLVFQIGEVDTDTSYINVEGGAAAQFNLNCSLVLVVPTAQEIKRLGTLTESEAAVG